MRLDVAGFPADAPVEVTFAGQTVALVNATESGVLSTTIVVPARPQGSYPIVATSGSATATGAFVVAPRIRVTPATGRPGDVVEVSLRGFGRNEAVRIRFLVDGRYVQVGFVARTSNTGSANLLVTVPAGADPGQSSVRGDGTVVRAQTNAFVVTD